MVLQVSLHDEAAQRMRDEDGVVILTFDDPDQSAARIAERLDPPDDVHASGAYRRRLARVLTARALREASARAAR